MSVQADVSTPPDLATLTAEDFAALVAERDALAGALRVPVLRPGPEGRAGA